MEGKEGSEEELMWWELKLKRSAARQEKVEEWLRVGGEYRGGDGKFYQN